MESPVSSSRFLWIPDLSICLFVCLAVSTNAVSVAQESTDQQVEQPTNCCPKSGACCGCAEMDSVFGVSNDWVSSFLGNADRETTLGRRIWAGYRWERRTGNDGVSPLDGTLNGVSIGWRSRNIDALFASVETVFMDGGFNPTVGGRTDYQEWQFESLFGYTFSDECRSWFLTPYAGFRFRHAENILGAPLNAEALQDVWTAPFGIRSDLLLTDDVAVGVDARLQWKIKDDQAVNTALFTILDDASDVLTYRIDVPVTIKLCTSAELVIRPYYEWDRFDSDSTTRITRIDEYGLQASLLIRY